MKGRWPPLLNLVAEETQKKNQEVISFAVATHHQLAEIRASRQNIKEADIYWPSTCVFSVDLITVLPLFTPNYSFLGANLDCRRSYLWRSPEMPHSERLREQEGRGSRSRGNKRENDRERILFPHAELVECQNSVTGERMLGETRHFTSRAQTHMNRQKDRGSRKDNVVRQRVEEGEEKHCHREGTSRKPEHNKANIKELWARVSIPSQSSAITHGIEPFPWLAPICGGFMLLPNKAETP